MKFGTKAETLAYLNGLITSASVLPQLCFTLEQWSQLGLQKIIQENNSPDWLTGTVIVRSSALSEDSEHESMAGHFTSVANVEGIRQLEKAIDKVISSFKRNSLKDQVFVQPMLKDVVVSGVAFTLDPSSAAPYYAINYDDISGSTETVTSGCSNNVQIFYQAKAFNRVSPDWKGKVIQLLKELESFFDCDRLDVEFALDVNGELYLLQVRKLVINVNNSVSFKLHSEELSSIAEKIQSISKPHPYLFGRRTVFGNMPDWNPAEIVGVRPRPLSLSLYKELVTDNIWAYQRQNYGYRNLRSFPLLIAFAGLPYIDVRVSFNSFIPSDIEESLAERLIDHYIDCLCETPSHHDKVEFEIIYSCYTIDLPERLVALKRAGFSDEDCGNLSNSLRKLTNRIINSDSGLWKQDTEKIKELQKRQEIILSSNLEKIEKIYWLLEDCKRYGTLPFAGLARAGFIAVQLLRSLVAVGIITENEYGQFMNTLDTVSSRMNHDFLKLSRDGFLDKYGHLRPGTYDILSPRYDEGADQYFNWKNKGQNELHSGKNSFFLSLDTLNRLEKMLISHQLDHNVLSLFNFIKEAIEGREYSKFIFSKSLSEAMKLFVMLGEELGFCKEDLSYADIQTVKYLYASSENPKSIIARSIEHGKDSYRVTSAVNLPPLINNPEDVYQFELPQNVPNFITLKSVTGEVVRESSTKEKLKDNIIMIESADPGYDWVFSHKIGGLVTMYGGANSHMAIRASELGIPSVIGAGETLFRQWEKAKILMIDCGNRQVKLLQ